MNPETRAPGDWQRLGMVPWRKRAAHWLDRRRPMSNQHCERMVVDYMRAAGWTFLDVVRLPQGPWHVWLARPPQATHPTIRLQAF